MDPKVEYPGTNIARVTQQNHCPLRKYGKIIKSTLKIPVYHIVPSLLASFVLHIWELDVTFSRKKGSISNLTKSCKETVYLLPLRRPGHHFKTHLTVSPSFRCLTRASHMTTCNSILVANFLSAIFFFALALVLLDS